MGAAICCNCHDNKADPVKEVYVQRVSALADRSFIARELKVPDPSVASRHDHGGLSCGGCGEREHLRAEVERKVVLNSDPEKIRHALMKLTGSTKVISW
mmetsp:Transcript_82953/g.230418  ORF Transcript_82953/g.230418 Transcript_82953/m.230418 type:complete len:99 (+) Transcript_82953:77-373(+)